MFFVSQICFVFSHMKRTFFIFREERRGNNYPGLICQRFWFRGKHFYSLLTLYLAQRNEDFSKTYTSKKANLRQFNSCYHLMYSHIATLKIGKPYQNGQHLTTCGRSLYVPNFGRNWTKKWDFSSRKKLHFPSLIQRKSKICNWTCVI